jgi:hypothetical protein
MRATDVTTDACVRAMMSRCCFDVERSRIPSAQAHELSELAEDEPSVAARREALQLALPHLSAAARALRAAIAAAAPSQQQRSSQHSPRGRGAATVSVPLGALEAMQSVGALPDALLPFVNDAHAAAAAATAAAAAAKEEDTERVHARPARASSYDTAPAPTRGEQLMAAATAAAVDFSPEGAGTPSLRRAAPAPPATPAAPRRAAPPPPPPPRA